MYVYICIIYNLIIKIWEIGWHSKGVSRFHKIKDLKLLRLSKVHVLFEEPKGTQGLGVLRVYTLNSIRFKKLFFFQNYAKAAKTASSPELTLKN